MVKGQRKGNCKIMPRQNRRSLHRHQHHRLQTSARRTPHTKPTYLRVVAAYRPSKQDPYRIRWTVGGNRILYDGDKYTPNAELTTVKLLLNSVISTTNNRFMTIDLKDFYLNTPLTKYEYTWVQEDMIADEIIKE